LEQELVEMDLDEGVLRLTPRYLEMAASRDKLPGQPPPDVVKIEEPPPRVAEALSECDQELLDMLVALRKDIADREDVPPYVIFPDRSLHEMAAMKPGTRLAFSNMFGVTTKKLNDYGDMFIQKINAYRFQKVQKAGLS
jgi:superfamily II DNA helicase RecQ